MTGTVALAAASEPSQPGAVPTRVLLVEHADYVAGLGCQVQAKYLRRRGAADLLSAHPDLQAWMSRPAGDRLAEARRLNAWPFLSWCFATGRLVPDLALLAGKGKGAHYTTWASFHTADVDRVAAAARGLGWVPAWVQRVSVNALAVVCLTRQIGLAEITDEELAAVSEDIANAVTLAEVTRKNLRGQHHSLRAVCYQLDLLTQPPPHGNVRPRSLEQRVAVITQPRLRATVLHYLRTVSSTLRPTTIEGRADSLTLFTGWLADTHPEVTALTQLTRTHLEEFLAYDAARACRGRTAGTGRRISVGHHAHTVRDLRGFFDDLAVWDWADRPPRLVLHRGDLPRLPTPLPRALAPDVDLALMRAVTTLDDVAARAGLTLLRGAGLRIGELLDLELDCLWDLPGHGTWLKVPLGKLNTERVVPLDPDTLAALDAWMGTRGQQRAMPHPRHGRHVDFLFTIGGARVGASRIRRGLTDAITAAGLTDTTGGPLRITPHQLRHTYATSLVNAGMSLQALMALLGHVTPEMTLRYAALADGTVRGAYDAAMAKLTQRRQLPLVLAGRPQVPDRVQWLHAEMLKTRVAHGYCSRHLATEACPYANICEQCDNYTTTAEFLPQLTAQLADEHTLRDDAEARGWDSEVARHARVIASLQRHLDRLQRDPATPKTP